MASPQSGETEAIRAGDRNAFAALHTTLAPRVHGYLRRLTNGDNAQAEDLTQEVFVAAYTGRQTFAGTVPVLGWLLGIARRRWRDSRRRSALPQTSLGDMTPDAEAATNENIEANVIRAAHLQACLTELDPAHRRAVLLVLGHGLTYAEAAAEMNEPIGTVKWRVHAATRLLRARLSENEEGEAHT